MGPSWRVGVLACGRVGQGDFVARLAQIVMIAGVSEKSGVSVEPKGGVEIHPLGALADAIHLDGCGAVEDEQGVVLSHGSIISKRPRPGKCGGKSGDEEAGDGGDVVFGNKKNR